MHVRFVQGHDTSLLHRRPRLRQILPFAVKTRQQLEVLAHGVNGCVHWTESEPKVSYQENMVRRCNFKGKNKTNDLKQQRGRRQKICILVVLPRRIYSKWGRLVGDVLHLFAMLETIR